MPYKEYGQILTDVETGRVTLLLACATVRTSKEIQEILARYGFSSLGTTPGKFASYITTERERWIKVVKASGVLLGH